MWNSRSWASREIRSGEPEFKGLAMVDETLETTPRFPRVVFPSRVANAFEGTTSLTRREMFSGADHPLAIGSTRYMMNVDRSQA